MPEGKDSFRRAGIFAVAVKLLIPQFAVRLAEEAKWASVDKCGGAASLQQIDTAL